MLSRFLSTIGLWFVVFATLYLFGVQGGFFLLILASILTQLELYALLKKMEYNSLGWVGLIIGVVMLIVPIFLSSPYDCFEVMVSCFVISIVLILSYIVVVGTPSSILEVFVPTVLGIVYVPLMFSLPVAFIRYIEFIHGSGNPALYMIVWMVAVAKSSDIGGLVIGSLIGGKKMSPYFSPNKTVGGLVGAILFAVTIGATAQLVMMRNLGVFSMKWAVIISAVLSLVAVVGDLIESALKRLANVKDSGKIIPGIGGVFDLTDSVVLSLPVGIILVKWLVL
ncbi:MAG: phosphatidate cytidylyltransferase [Puniceicoccales bacterium]|jgi:phosphatidate cytidylyltransferase|nr:phosphatidate cytidylyltransferase [Puniceicoccales bacterium]